MFVKYKNIFDGALLIGDYEKVSPDQLSFFQSLESLTDRNTIKAQLGILNPTFKELFEKNRFKKTKDENLYYLNLLIDEFYNKLENYEDTEEFNEFYDSLCDDNYLEAQKAETALKEAKRRDYGFSDYETVIRKAEAHLNEVVNKDCYADAVRKADAFKTDVYKNIEFIIQFYNSHAEKDRKQEQRNRDALFYYILHLLSLFYDTVCYIPDGYIEGIKEELKWYIPLSKRLEYEINSLSLLGVIYGALKCKKETEEYKKEIEKSKERLKSLVGLAREIEERKLKTLLLKTFSLGEVKLESYMGICEVAEFYYEGSQEF
ncbi:hypothetical protein B5G06_12125 [Flavonifractor sp. An52]|uniref:hypothetical protein n=1 Tax=Flavonifractor sp. An52 TaxID=1965642 RepID=UPI000B3A7A42|nr:hypothetical protein [Flavonifractor sp. An52]OUN79937.1 hypothetical protein B5G06_12125 [Flavonifractor sp. An52]